MTITVENREIPVLLLTGYLGSGKTTLLNRILSNRKGIKIDVTEDNVVNIELHIVVRHGVNIAAAGDSIISEVRYNVEEMTGMKVGKVNVFVDSLMTD